jgi:hypothetical protein
VKSLASCFQASRKGTRSNLLSSFLVVIRWPFK